MENITAKVTRTIKLHGYVLDADILKRAEEVAIEVVSGQESAGEEVRRDLYSIVTNERAIFEFGSFEALLQALDEESHTVRSLTLRHGSRKGSGVEVAFNHDGSIRVSGYGGSPDFRFNIDRLCEILSASREQRGRSLHIFLLHRGLRRLVVALFAVSSLILLGSILMYLNGISIGVNIDPNLIPKGNEPFRRVADALKSADSNQKLDALLVQQLCGFTNVRDYLAGMRKLLILSLAGIAVALLLTILIRVFRNLYPAAFFAFGRNQNAYQNLQTRRQIWNVAVVIGFMVNVAAGIVVAILTR